MVITVIQEDVFIGKPNILAKRLVDTTFECMWKGIEVVKPGHN